nr:MAG TPA: hypothetical protein [Caudoviricetes sp.]
MHTVSKINTSVLAFNTQACFYKCKPTCASEQEHDAHRSLTASATNNRPHCLYRRPASRQARKPANDRENLVRLLDGETPEPSE